MKYEKIGKGFKIQTPDGYAIADSYNGSIIYFTEHIIDVETGEEIDTQDKMLTKSEVGRYMKESDRKNHEHLIWEEE